MSASWAAALISASAITTGFVIIFFALLRSEAEYARKLHRLEELEFLEEAWLRYKASYPPDYGLLDGIHSRAATPNRRHGPSPADQLLPASLDLVKIGENESSVAAAASLSGGLEQLFMRLGPPPEGLTAAKPMRLRDGGGSQL